MILRPQGMCKVMYSHLLGQGEHHLQADVPKWICFLSSFNDWSQEQEWSTINQNLHAWGLLHYRSKGGDFRGSRCMRLWLPHLLVMKFVTREDSWVGNPPRHQEGVVRKESWQGHVWVFSASVGCAFAHSLNSSASGTHWGPKGNSGKGSVMCSLLEGFVVRVRDICVVARILNLEVIEEAISVHF